MGRAASAFTSAIIRVSRRAVPHLPRDSHQTELHAGVRPGDGMYLAVAQVRDQIRRHGEHFLIDKSSAPHHIRVA